jgi:hypothetical protein
MFDVGPKKHQVSVHEDFLDINAVDKEVFKKTFKYMELVQIPGCSHLKAYRIPGSLDTFKLFLEYLVGDIPQSPESSPLWNLDQKKAEDLLEFARKWDMDELQDELREFLRPLRGY